MVKVSLVKLEGNEVFAAVKQAVDLVGGIGSYVSPGDRVLIKVNMFVPAPTHVARITDPRVAIAVARLVHEAGGEAVVADRMPWIHQHLEAFPEIGRYATVASIDEMPFKMQTLHGARHLRAPIPLPDLVDECDVFINVPGLRTHQATQVSNGMKNLMGLLPGTATFHVHNYGLEGSIVDLNFHRPSDLVITDALISLQGNFPPAGEPKETNLVMASANVAAMDAVAAVCAGYSPRDLPYLVEANERGLGPIDLAEVETVGEPLERVLPGTRLTLTPVSLEAGGERIKVLAGQLCEGCRRALGGAIYEIMQSPDGQNLEPVTVIVGRYEKTPQPGPGPVIVFGNCAYAHRRLGEHVRGCPPLVSKGKDVILAARPSAPAITAGSGILAGLAPDEWPRTARDLGLDGLEVDASDLEFLAGHSEARAGFAKALAAAGLPVRRFTLGDDLKPDRWTGKVKRLAALAKSLGAGQVVLRLTGILPNRLPAGERRVLLTKIAELASLCADHGLLLVLEDREASLDELLRLHRRLHGKNVALGVASANLPDGGDTEAAVKRVQGAAVLFRGIPAELLAPKTVALVGLLAQGVKEFTVSLIPSEGAAAAAEIARLRRMLA